MCSCDRVCNPIICQPSQRPCAYFTTCYITLPSAQLCHAFVNVISRTNTVKKPFMSYFPCQKWQVREQWQRKKMKGSRRKYQKPGGEKNNNTFPGHDISRCYGNLSHTTTSLKVNIAWWKEGKCHYIVWSAAVLCTVEKSIFLVLVHTVYLMCSYFFFCSQEEITHIWKLIFAPYPTLSNYQPN